MLIFRKSHEFDGMIFVNLCLAKKKSHDFNATQFLALGYWTLENILSMGINNERYVQGGLNWFMK